MPGPLNKPLFTNRPLTVGRLRDELRVESRTTVLDSFRQPIPTWVPEAETIWGEVDLDGGAEFSRGGGQQSSVTGQVTIRTHPGLNSTKRLVWLRNDGAEVVLNIKACPPHMGGMGFTVVMVEVEAKPGAV